MAAKYHSDTQEKIETITYSPGAQTTGDLETGTKTVSATSETSGTGNADYSQALTLAKPLDARLEVKSIVSRLKVTIDSMTAGHLYCRVYVDAQAATHRLFNKDWTSTGEKLGAADLTSGVAFNLLRDGSAHTFYFFFWVDTGNAVISFVQLWEGVGSCSTVGYQYTTLEVNHSGFLGFAVRLETIGSGTPVLRFRPESPDAVYYLHISGHAAVGNVPSLLVNNEVFSIYGSVVSDMNYLAHLSINLRSQ